MQQRLKNHQMRNEARKLTPVERKAKNRRKLTEDTSLQTHVALFRVDDLSDKRTKIKIDLNFHENHLSGCIVFYHLMNLVVVEGGPKALRRFKKLMLKRIDWNASVQKSHEPAGTDSTPSPNPPQKKENKCSLIWEGIVSKPHFKNFKLEQCPTENSARNFLRAHSVEHYWDLAKNFRPITEEI